MKNWRQTVLSQFQSSPRIMSLLAAINAWISPDANFENFYNQLWNIDTAEGYGLDVWGRIVVIPRIVTLTDTKVFGFAEAGDRANFGGGPFYTGTLATENFTLTDDVYRQFILAKAAFNITDGSIPAINAIVMNLFPNRGNCFSGDTEILTESGFARLRELVGERIGILSPVSGDIELADVKSYGIQPLNKITISNARFSQERAGTFCRVATPDHRWILQDGSYTESLRSGDVLQAGRSTIDVDPVGWVHGFVFRDGSKDHSNAYRARLCGKKARHLQRFFDAFPDATVSYAQSHWPDPRVRIKSLTNLKELPPKGTDLSYVRGFIEGLLAADGCFSRRGNDAYQFHNKNRNVVEWVRDHLIVADYAPCGKVHEYENAESSYAEGSICKVLFRQSQDHKGYRVTNIEPMSPDEVFCINEPKYHQLTMRDGLRSSNCYVTDGANGPTGVYFGFAEAGDRACFGHGPFGDGAPTSPSNMTMTYVFDFPLEPFEQAMVQSGVLPRPAGVSANYIYPGS